MAFRLCSLRRATDYSGNYASILATSLLTREMLDHRGASLSGLLVSNFVTQDMHVALPTQHGQSFTLKSSTENLLHTVNIVHVCDCDLPAFHSLSLYSSAYRYLRVQLSLLPVFCTSTLQYPSTPTLTDMTFNLGEILILNDLKL